MNQQIRSSEDLRLLLDQVSVREPLGSMSFAFEFAVLPGNGWILQATFSRPDRITGDVGRGISRAEFIPCGASASSVVKTCWLLVELTMRHEAMEAFHFDGARIFDPHHDVADLAKVGR